MDKEIPLPRTDADIILFGRTKIDYIRDILKAQRLLNESNNMDPLEFSIDDARYRISYSEEQVLDKRKKQKTKRNLILIRFENKFDFESHQDQIESTSLSLRDDNMDPGPNVSVEFNHKIGERTIFDYPNIRKALPAIKEFISNFERQLHLAISEGIIKI